ncbi:MAG: 5-formyltetrahydrofolate cyclo-ligase [Verrucomicrobiia bacterium]
MNPPKASHGEADAIGPAPGSSGVQPGPEVVAAKAALRTEMRVVLKGIDAVQRAQDSLRVCNLLKDQEVWRGATRVLCYAPRGDELDLTPLIDAAAREGKRIALPRFDVATRLYEACEIDCPISQLMLGYSGIREPSADCPVVPFGQLDLVLVPGLAFDVRGGRLGRGRAFYDRILANIRGAKCGVAYEEQVRPSIPLESHDVLIHCLVTPVRWRDFRPREVTR